MIDSPVVRVHQHGACITSDREQHMGPKSRGLASKIDALVDASNLRRRLGLTPRETHDNRPCSGLLAESQPGATFTRLCVWRL